MFFGLTAVFYAQLRLPTMSPQTYLDGLMSNRGYRVDRVHTIDTAYYSKPTPLQKASYQGFLINVAKSGDVDGLADLLTSGLSPNPSNLYGESLCHLVCRLGKHHVLQTMLQSGTSLEICDDYGRTPLHDACWAGNPAFEVVDLIMTAGREETHHLFNMVDNRGSTPLSYIRKEHWAQWMEFLQSKKDIYWPVVDKSKGKKIPPVVARELPNSRPPKDPANALPTEIAMMVASGTMSPIEARQIVHEEGDFDEDSSSSDSYDESPDGSSCSLDDEAECCSPFSRKFGIQRAAESFSLSLVNKSFW
jgi:Ankyrin repeats (3 copies)